MIKQPNNLLRRGLLLVALLAISACSGSSAPTPPPPRSDCAESSSGLNLVQSTPGFEEDILPLLKSTSDGKAYKCTVCHQAYNDYNVVAKQSEIEKIISEIDTGSMPFNADRVAPADVQTFRAWAAAGMPRTRSTTGGDTNNTGDNTNTDNTNADGGNSGGVTSTPPSNNVDQNVGRFGEGGDPWGQTEEDTGSSSKPGGGCS